MLTAFKGALWATAVLLPTLALAAPVPFWQTTLDDVASSTVDGGQLLGTAPNFPAGSMVGSYSTGNKFQSTGDSRLFWPTAAVQSIFTGWDDSAGITVDAIISGFGPGVTRDSGVWSVGHRNPDKFFIIAVQSIGSDNRLRINIRNHTGFPDGGNTRTLETAPLGLQADVDYRVTVRQHISNGNGGDLEVYLESLNDGGTQYAPGTLVGTLDLAGNYVFNFPLTAGSGPALGMSIGNRHPFGSANTILKNGEAIDEVRVYNGNYLPSEIPIPEPATWALLTLAAGALLRRSRR